MPDRRTGYYVAGRDWPAMGSGIPLEELYRGLEGITEGGPAPMSDQPAEVTVPQAAVAAALSARDESQSMTDEGLTRDMLEAAAPHIAEAAQEKAVAAAVAAERERIRQMAMDHAATWPARCRGSEPHHALCHGVHREPFADLLEPAP